MARMLSVLHKRGTLWQNILPKSAGPIPPTMIDPSGKGLEPISPAVESLLQTVTDTLGMNTFKNFQQTVFPAPRKTIRTTLPD